MSGQEPLPTAVRALLLRAAKRGSLLLESSACTSGSNDVVTVLIRQYGAKPDSCNNNIDTPVHISALNGNVTVFNTLVDTFARNPKARGSESRTPLRYAVGRGHTEMFEKLFTEYNCDCLARPIQIAVALNFQVILNLFLSCQSVTEIIVHSDTSSMINTPEKVIRVAQMVTLRVILSNLLLYT